MPPRFHSSLSNLPKWYITPPHTRPSSPLSTPSLTVDLRDSDEDNPSYSFPHSESPTRMTRLDTEADAEAGNYFAHFSRFNSATSLRSLRTYQSMRSLGAWGESMEPRDGHRSLRSRVQRWVYGWMLKGYYGVLAVGGGWLAFLALYQSTKFCVQPGWTDLAGGLAAIMWIELVVGMFRHGRAWISEHNIIDLALVLCSTLVLYPIWKWPCGADGVWAEEGVISLLVLARNLRVLAVLQAGADGPREMVELSKKDWRE